MTELQTLTPPKPILIDSVAACRKCGQPMRLVGMEQHEFYSNLITRTFACDCGGYETDIIQAAI